MRQNDFDRHFNRTARTINWAFGAIIVMWILGFLVSLAAIGGLGYVAYHFLSKVW